MAMNYKADPATIEWMFFEAMKRNSIAACKRGGK